MCEGRDLATNEADVAEETVVSYFRERTESLAPEYATTIALWFSRIEDIDTLPGGGDLEPSEAESQDEPNGYDGDSRSEN